MDLIKAIEETQKRPGAQGFNVGDTVEVFFKIIEGKTERIQRYQGVVICKKNEGARQTFTVRKESYGVGVEVDIVRPGKVRRAKLYYLRDKVGKDKKVKTLVGAKITAEIAARNARAEAAAHATEEAIKMEHQAEHQAQEQAKK